MAKAIPATTINPAEAAHFGKLAADWWDPKGSSAMLHKLNPVRLRFIRAACDVHWGLNPRDVRPLAGKSAIDVGCGAGLLCEPLARLGADVVGVDAAPENIAAVLGYNAADLVYDVVVNTPAATIGGGPFDAPILTGARVVYQRRTS